MTEETPARPAENGDSVERNPLGAGFIARLIPSGCTNHGMAEVNCTACVDICPHGSIAFRGETGAGLDRFVPGIDAVSCEGCMLCCPVCPNSTIEILRFNLAQIKSRLDAVASHYDRVYLTCGRTGASSRSGAIVEVPCLGGLPWEFYLACLADYDEPTIFLPVDLCPSCPHAGGETLMMEAIDRAERESGENLGLISDEDDLDFSVPLLDDELLGRRGFLTSIADYLSDSTRRSSVEYDLMTGTALPLTSRERAERVRKVREANRKAFEERQERFDEARVTGRFRRRDAVMSPRRRILVDTIRAHPELDGIMTVTARNSEACTKCFTCLDVCPMSARRMRSMQLETDDTCCTGCGKCVLACPAEALHLVEAPLSPER